MSDTIHQMDVSKEAGIIRKAAKVLLKKFPTDSAEHRILKKAVVRPIEYMRWAEFYAILKDLTIQADDLVLDIGSPQWFSIVLAIMHPKTKFIYTNILENEIKPFENIAKAYHLTNISYMLEDVRALTFPKQHFDKVISISVLEHIFPAEGGDVIAFNEIKKVLKENGSLHITLPFKEKRNIVYSKGAVYEREEGESNFYAREYDKEMFEDLLKETGFSAVNKYFICEKKGVFALDYYGYGPGQRATLAKSIVIFPKAIEKILQIPVTESIAKKQLLVSNEVCHRVVNISAKLRRSDI